MEPTPLLGIDLATRNQAAALAASATSASGRHLRARSGRNQECVYPRHRRDARGVPVAHACMKCARGICFACGNTNKVDNGDWFCHEYPKCGVDSENSGDALNHAVQGGGD